MPNEDQVQPKLFELPKAKCLRCGYEWTPRTANVRTCANCRSAYWDVPKDIAKFRELDDGEQE